MLVASLLAIGPTAASAQGGPGTQAPPAEAPVAGRFNLGPSVSFTPAVVFVGGTDSNLGRSLDSVGGDEFYAVPQVEGWIGRGRVRLNVAGAMEYGWTSSNGDQINHRYEGRLDSNGPRVSLYGQASHADLYAPPSDFVGFELGIRSRRVQNLFEGGLRFTPPGRLRYTALARHTRLRYDADAVYEGSSLQFNLNRDANAFQGDIDLRITPLSSAVFTAAVSRDRFIFAPERDGDGYTLLGGFQFNTSALVGGRIQGGVLRYDTKASNGSYGGPTYNVGLTVARNPVLLDVSGTRRIDFSFDPDKGFYVSTGIDAFSIVRLRSAWELFGRGSWRRLSPQGPRAEIEGEGTLQVYKGGLARGFGSHVKIGVEAERYVARGPAPFTAVRGIVFLTYGTTRLQRLDRPLPGEF